MNKAAIVNKELGILSRPVDNLFPITLPYCDLDLTPKWDYDIEKARMLNCPADDGLGGGYIALMTILGIMVIGLCVFAAMLVSKEQQGQPLFSPLINVDDNVKPAGAVEMKKVEVDNP